MLDPSKKESSYLLYLLDFSIEMWPRFLTRGLPRVGRLPIASIAAASATFMFSDEGQPAFPEKPISIPQSKMTTEFFIRQSSILSEEAASRLLQFVISALDDSVQSFLEANSEMANLYEASRSYTLTEFGEERLTELRLVAQEKLGHIRDLELLFLYVRKTVEANSEVCFLVGEEFCSKQASEKLHAAISHVQDKLDQVKLAELDLLNAKKSHIEKSVTTAAAAAADENE